MFRQILTAVFLLFLLAAILAGGVVSPADGDVRGPEVLVLGTAQDGGLPHVACSCERCEAARREPALRRHVASLGLVLPGVGAFLIDATPDVRPQLHRLAQLVPPPQPPGGVDRSPLSGVFLTHAHMGHYLGLAFFGFEAVHTAGLPVYATPSMAAFLRGNGPWDQLVEKGNIQISEIAPGKAVELAGGVSVTALAVPHRREYTDTVAYLLRGPRASLFYAPDTDGWEGWDPPLPELLAGVDVALLDGTFHSAGELPGRAVSAIGHPLMTTTMDLLAPLVAAGGTRVYFTHLNHSNPALDPSGPARERLEERGFAVAEDGQRFPL